MFQFPYECNVWKLSRISIHSVLQDDIKTIGEFEKSDWATVSYPTAGGRGIHVNTSANKAGWHVMGICGLIIHTYLHPISEAEGCYLLEPLLIPFFSIVAKSLEQSVTHSTSHIVT